MKHETNEPIGMQRKAFSEKIRLTERQVLRFCELNVFEPIRPADAPNNRRYFTEADFKIAELIHILTKLGCNPPEIQRIFEEHDRDLDSILNSAIQDLKKRTTHYQNLIVAAEMAQSLGTSLFSFSDMSDLDIDKFAETVRKAEPYKKTRDFFREKSEKDINKIINQLRLITNDFSMLMREFNDDFNADEFFARAEKLVSDYASIYSKISKVDSNHMLLSLGGVFTFGDGILVSEADEIGGEGTADFMGPCFILSWISQMSRLVFPLVVLLNNYRDNPSRTEDVATELLSLFDIDSTSVPIPNNRQKFEAPLDPQIGLINLVFDFANDMRDEPEFLSFVKVEANSLPTKEQFEYALELLNKHASKSTM